MEAKTYDDNYLRNVRFAVYCGRFKPGEPGSDEGVCYKYGYSRRLIGRISQHKSGREYPGFELVRVLEVSTEDIAKAFEVQLGKMVDDEKLRLKYRGFRECFRASDGDFAKLWHDLESWPTDNLPVLPEGQFKCEYCEAFFSTVGNCRRHQRNNKGCLALQSQLPETEREDLSALTRTCEGCEKGFGRVDEFKRHVAVCKGLLRKQLSQLQEEAPHTQEKAIRTLRQQVESLERENVLLRDTNTRLLDQIDNLSVALRRLA
jgi:hypothetical protein